MRIARFDLAIAPAKEAWEVAVMHGDAELARFAMAALDDPSIARTVESLRDRTAIADDVRALGARLYDGLIAPVWDAIAAAAGDAVVIELALWFAGAPSLAGLPWEMMRGPAGFLAAGALVGKRPVDVVITRRFARARVDTPALVAPLRYLFAIGTELGDPVRAGAECMGVLHQIGPAICERVVERQSVAALGGEIAAFDPHVVHLICHGRETTAGGIELALWDDDARAAIFVGAAELCDRMVWPSAGGRRAPVFAIVSACSSGECLGMAGGSNLAGALVAAGVPIAIGMAAEISDLACRLFARRFGEALAEHRPLLIAAALGRAAALHSTQMPASSFEWGLIQLVLGDDVDTAIAVTAPTAGSDHQRLLSWLQQSQLPIDLGDGPRRYPALCASTGVLDGFYQLVRSPQRTVLALVSHPPGPDVRVGLSRACAEVAALAIRTGHVPVLVNHRPAEGDPVDARQLTERLIDGLKDAREWRGLPPVPLALEAVLATPAIDPRALRAALKRDADTLRAAARAAHPLIERARGEVVIVLHDVHRYVDAVKTVLALCRPGGGKDDRLLIAIGYAMRPPPPPPARGRRAERAEPWRVDNDSRVSDWLAGNPTWITEIKLGALDPSTAGLAYQRVLLHPFLPEPPVARPQLFLDLATRDADDLVTVLEFLDNGSERYPGQFDGPSFGKWVKAAAKYARVLRAADDEAILQALRKP